VTENVLGGFGLIIYLAVIAAVIFGIYWGIVNWAYPALKEQIDGSTNPAASPAPDIVE
jgi:hypothetical protein